MKIYAPIIDRYFPTTYFATTEFKELDTHGQASQIFEYEHQLDGLGHQALEWLTTILIKSMCTCQFLDFVPDETTGVDNVFVTRKHSPSCAVVRCPITEDLSVSQIQRRQKREICFDHPGMLMIEEISSNVKRKPKHSG